MTSRVEWKNEQSLEARALYALWRNHPLTAVKDRWGERAHRMARANRDMLLSWAAAQPDYRLRDCRNIGAATLAWIRANQSPTPTGLNVDDLTRFIDDALEDWSTRPDPEPSDQVAVYLARRIAENIVTPPPAEPTLDVDDLPNGVPCRCVLFAGRCGCPCHNEEAPRGDLSVVRGSMEAEIERLRRIEHAARDVDGMWSERDDQTALVWEPETAETLLDLRAALGEPTP